MWKYMLLLLLWWSVDLVSGLSGECLSFKAPPPPPPAPAAEDDDGAWEVCGGGTGENDDSVASVLGLVCAEMWAYWEAAAAVAKSEERDPLTSVSRKGISTRVFIWARSQKVTRRRARTCGSRGRSLTKMADLGGARG